MFEIKLQADSALGTLLKCMLSKHVFLKQWKEKERNHVYRFVYLMYIQLP